jgi:lysine-arginine-ornithine-binding protein
VFCGGRDAPPAAPPIRVHEVALAVQQMNQSSAAAARAAPARRPARDARRFCSTPSIYRQCGLAAARGAKMKRHLMTLIAVVGLAAAGWAQAQQKLRIGVEGNYPPFSQIDASGQLSGFDIDIARAVCTQMKAECSFVQQEWSGMIPALNANRYDMIVASMAITEERKKAVNFSDKYYNVPSRWIAKQGSTLAPTPAGLKGKKIGVLRNSGRDRAITEQFKDAEIVRYAKETDIYLDLVAGRIDIGITSAVVGSESFLKKPEGKGYAFIGQPWYIDQGVGIAVRKSDEALLAQINAAIKAIRADGTYKKLAAKYFDFDIYGD